MSHHLKRAQLSLALALDYLETAEMRAEEHTGGPNPTSLDVARHRLAVKRAVYDVNTAGWHEAERALQATVEPLSHLTRALARGGRLRERSATERVVIDQLVQARKAIRAALINLRLRKDRP